MKQLDKELLDVARLNPVPPESVSGEGSSDRARALRDQLIGSDPDELDRRSRRVGVRLAVAVIAVAFVGAGTAVAARLFTEQDVERYLPQGSTVFANTQPRCAAVEDGLSYRCRLARAPSAMSVTGPDGLPAFKGAKFATVDDESRVNGGCIALNNAGTDWACYVGARAVDAGILSDDVLGQKQADPAAG